MRMRFVCAALVALGLAGGLGFQTAGRAAPAGDYPYQGQSNFAADGTVKMVDPDRDRITVTDDSGKVYSVDTYQADIRLLVTSKPGETGDLVRGMRVHLTGTLVGQDVIEADRVRVLPLTNTSPPATDSNDKGDAHAPVPADSADNSINLRGTVSSVDDSRHSFVVRVNSHSRTVHIDGMTDLSGFPEAASDQFPLQIGDRVTVSGTLRDDGTVLADTVALSRPTVSQTQTSDYAPHTLTGRITSPSNKFLSRDIKIRVSQDRETTVHVPSGTPVREDDQPISVHELNKGDIVRVYGTSDGDDFRATRIEVLQSGDDADNNP